MQPLKQFLSELVLYFPFPISFYADGKAGYTFLMPSSMKFPANLLSTSLSDNREFCIEGTLKPRGTNRVGNYLVPLHEVIFTHFSLHIASIAYFCI